MSSVVFSRAIEKISEEFAFQMCNTAKRLECPMHTKSGNFSLGKTWPFVFVLTSEKNTWQILQLKFLRTCVSVCACILCIGVSFACILCICVLYYLDDLRSFSKLWLPSLLKMDVSVCESITFSWGARSCTSFL